MLANRTLCDTSSVQAVHAISPNNPNLSFQNIIFLENRVPKLINCRLYLIYQMADIFKLQPSAFVMEVEPEEFKGRSCECVPALIEVFGKFLELFANFDLHSVSINERDDLYLPVSLT